MPSLRALSVIISFFAAVAWTASSSAESTDFGFSKIDVTPQAPLRLSGYQDRAKPFESVSEKLWVRTMALRTKTGTIYTLASVETIGFPGTLTTSIARRLQQDYGIAREQFVLCSTHSHTAPQLAGGLPNLFIIPLTDDEETKMEAYTNWLADRVVECVGKAIEDLSPGRLLRGEGTARFAVNRRVIAGNRWKGFGVRREGSVDHSLPVLKVVSPDGTLRGIVFNYACHCTTLTAKFNRVSGDWAGFAQDDVEEMFPGAIALCTIGCGADANPQPRGELDMAKAHGRAVAIEVRKIVSAAMQEVRADPTGSFGYAGLPVDVPRLSDVKKQLEHERPQIRYRAKDLLEIHERKGRFPESYPMPIQTWRFADELTLVFLGGEVVADYALRLKREIKSTSVWVTAYANDVFAYVPSERIRQEGGYEVDFSMVFYNQPGPWSEGTEEIVIDRVHEILADPNLDGSLSSEAALATFRLPKGFEIELVASEPLIADPVHFAFGPDGKLWVVQMSDYPRGLDGTGRPGGVVKFLEDTDQDGKFDEGTVFLDGLAYPTGVMPWRDGVLVCAAPDVFYAEDTNGDGKADRRDVLFSGFAEANPQHLINGFAYGLDHWLYLGNGGHNRNIRSRTTGTKVNISGRDVRIRPDDGLVDAVSGRTQYGRTRDDWGNWFGSENSKPIFHFVVSDRYLRRNANFPARDPKVNLILPTPAPPIFPTSRTAARFNDLYAANRFTSACSPILFRDTTLGPDIADSAFVCEPVHNLIHRSLIEPDGVTFRGRRHPDEQRAEFLTSTDGWFRPSWLATGSDGALWFADMYRHVIEHPEWIPETWQTRLNLRAGEDKGRIYRVYRTGHRPGPLPALDRLSTVELVKQLEKTNGWQRDTAQQLLIHQDDPRSAPLLRELAAESRSALARVHALHTLDAMDSLETSLIARALFDEDWRVQRQAILLSEPRLAEDPQLGERLLELVDHPERPVRFQLALTLGEWQDAKAGAALGQLVVRDRDDAWMRNAVLASAGNHAEHILEVVLADSNVTLKQTNLVEHLIGTALGNSTESRWARILSAVTVPQKDGIALWQVAALASYVNAIERGGYNLSRLAKLNGPDLAPLLERTEAILERASDLVADSAADVDDRFVGVRLIGHGFGGPGEDAQRLGDLLSPQTPLPLQTAAVASLALLRSDEVATICLDNWRSRSPRLKDDILRVLLSRPKWTESLLEAIENKTVPPGDLDASSRSNLTTHRNDAIATRARAVLVTAPSESRQAVLAAHERVLEMEGNPIRGATTFAQKCGACHRYRSRGGEIGPNLAALRDKSSEYLLVAVLDPNRAVERGFRAYLTATRDGRLFDGMVVAESTGSVTLAQPNGKKVILLRSDIEEFTSTGRSFMPEGLEKDLSPQDLADVFAFLQLGLNPIGSPDSQTLKRHRKWLKEASENSLVHVISAGERRKQTSWLGDIEVPICSAATPNSQLTWQSAPLTIQTGTAASTGIRLAVAMGAQAEPTGRFELRMNGKLLLAFGVELSDASWSNADGSITMTYHSMQANTTQTNGLLEIEVPNRLLSPGKRVEFTVTAPATPGESWFGLLPIE